LKVKLLVWTLNPEYWCYIASRTCRSPVGPIEIHETHVQTPELIRSHIKARLKDGHHSVFEHASFTFGIEGISRACSHQLVRHRIASYSQQSQRHISPSGIVLPESMKENAAVDGALNTIARVYKGLLELDYPVEDVRFILPQASTTNLVVTMNARALLHFFELRLHKSAQWEIRELAGRMLEEVKRVAPTIFEHILK